MKRKGTYILLVMLIGMMAACQPDTGCRQTNLTPMMTVTMRHVTDTTGAAWKVLTAWDSITVKGVGKDSLIYANRKNIEKLLLPTRTDSTACQFAVLYHGIWDTLSLRYENSPQFINMECGCSVYQTIQDIQYTRHQMDSIIIWDNSISPQQPDNILLIYLP